jgi:Glycosyltransferase family 10 (fucosyltransferase).
VNIKKSYTSIRQYLQDIRLNKNNQIRFYNFWDTQLPHEMWFARFIQHHKLNNNYSDRINFYSVLGSLDKLEKLHKGVNIFFSGENMHSDRFAEFRSLCQVKEFDLYIDFDTTLNEKSVRFPLWLLYTFSPESNEDDIKRKVEELRFPLQENRQGFCSLVASHDWNGIRGGIIDSLTAIDTVSSGGRFRKNTDDLNGVYSNHKFDFIRQYKFNICPENSNAAGYVTEKIFQSIEAGCIPIYWGSNNKPELDILNQNAILFWNQGEDNTNTISTIKELMADKKKYIDFISQQRLLPDAADVIWNYFNNLKQCLSDVITK